MQGGSTVEVTCALDRVERYIALKIKYIELEAALMSKMSGRGIAAVAFREVNSSKGPRSIMTFHFQWAT